MNMNMRMNMNTNINIHKAHEYLVCLSQMFDFSVEACTGCSQTGRTGCSGGPQTFVAPYLEVQHLKLPYAQLSEALRRFNSRVR
jgi:hypothetical protein